MGREGVVRVILFICSLAVSEHNLNSRDEADGDRNKIVFLNVFSGRKP